MRATVQVLFAFLLVAAPSLMAQAGETSGSADIGVWDASTEGSPDIVTEYEPNGGGPDVKLDIESMTDTATVELAAELRDGNDYAFELDFDIGRSIRSETALSALIHRLQHESLEHFTAVTNHGRVTYHDDLDPTSVYGIDYSLLEHRTEFQPKNSPMLTFGVGYRQQERDGVVQSTVVSHCDACHVVSQDRPIDESTSDVSFDAQLAWQRGQVTFSAVSREFETDPASISFTYDDALHPELRLPVFDNRLQFDSAEGPQPVDSRPEIGKDTFRLDGTFTLSGGAVLAAEGVWSETTNDSTGRSSDFSGQLLTVAKTFAESWSLRWRARTYTISNDDYFVDAVERLGIAGPQAGRTYREIYGFDPDFVSRSALNREVIESRLDVTKRWSRTKGSLRLFLDYENVDRDDYEVAPGETGSSTRVVGVSWWARPKRGWKTNVLAQHGETDDPFMVVNGQYSTLVSAGPLPNPFHPDAAQYYEFQDARIAESTASAASWDEVQLRGTYTSGTSSVSASYRWWDGDNREGDLTDWSRTLQAASFSIWSMPSEVWEWQLAYNWSDSELQAPTSIPLFDG